MLKVMKMFASLLHYKLLGIVVRGNDTCFPWKQKKRKKSRKAVTIFICFSTSSVAPKALLLLRKLDHNSLCWGVISYCPCSQDWSTFRGSLHLYPFHSFETVVHLMRFSMYKSHGVPEERFIPAIVCIFFHCFHDVVTNARFWKKPAKKYTNEPNASHLQTSGRFPTIPRGY